MQKRLIILITSNRHKYNSRSQPLEMANIRHHTPGLQFLLYSASMAIFGIASPYPGPAFLKRFQKQIKLYL